VFAALFFVWPLLVEKKSLGFWCPHALLTVRLWEAPFWCLIFVSWLTIKRCVSLFRIKDSVGRI